MGDYKAFGAYAGHASPRLVEKPRNTIGWQVGEGTRWHCPVAAQLNKPQLNTGSPIQTHTSELVVDLLHLTQDLMSSNKVPLITAHTPSPSFACGKPMVLLKFLNNFCAIWLGGGDGSWSSRSFLLLHCPWTSGSYTLGSLPLPPDSRASGDRTRFKQYSLPLEKGGDCSIVQPHSGNNGRSRFHPTSPSAPISDFCSWVLTLPSSLGSHLCFCSFSLPLLPCFPSSLLLVWNNLNWCSSPSYHTALTWVQLA